MDTKREFNTKTASFHLVSSHTIIIVQGAQRVQSFKLDLINHTINRNTTLKALMRSQVEKGLNFYIKDVQEKTKIPNFLLSVYTIRKVNS